MAERSEDKSLKKPSGGVDKVEELKTLIRDLHNGASPERAKARFDAVIRDISAKEIGAMEEQLIQEGMPVQEIQRLCDLHVAVVRDGLDRQGGLDGQAGIKAPPGHPVHTYLTENEIITRVANRLGELCGDAREEDRSADGWALEMEEVLEELAGIDNHYLRKENELFPVLERHGVTGPSKVMWGIHDEIRAQVKKAKAAVASVSGGPGVDPGDRAKDPVDPEKDAAECSEVAAKAGISLARAVVEMVYKENKVLLPLAQQTLSHQEWAEVRRGEDELGYAFQEPSAPFPKAPLPPVGPGGPHPGHDPAPTKPRPSEDRPGISLPIVSAAPMAPLPPGAGQSYVDLGTGRLSVEQVDLMLRHLPIEISFVDADGFVRYYSDTEERLFPRTPGAIGRHVENCHPPKSIHMVKEILEKFGRGESDVAEFWIQMQDRFIHIRYFAVRNGAKEYLGCLEVTQDVTEIRALEGQRRLLEWS